MLDVRLKPHRTSLRAEDASPQKLFVLLRIAAGQSVANARPPLALSLVLDTSLSMRAFVDQEAASRLAASGAHAQGTSQDGAQYRSLDATLPTLLDRAVEAAHALVDDARLKSDDQICIIHFDDEAHALWPLAPLKDKTAIHAAIEKLRGCAGQTQMGKGLQIALREMEKMHGAASRRVFVFTDGATQDEALCRVLATQISNLNAPIIALGFGPEYNAELMRELADATGGRPYHLQHIDELRGVLENEIGSSAREVVTDVRLQIKAVQGVHLERAHRVFPALGEITRADELRLGNVAAGAGAAFVLEFTVAGLARTASRARLAQLQFTARVPGNELRGVSTQTLAPVREDLIVEFTRDEKSLARIDEEVLGYVGQRNAAGLVENAIADLARDAHSAQQQLENAARLTSRSGNISATQMLHDAMDELNRTGAISPDTRRTVALGVRTHTVDSFAPQVSDDARGNLSDDEIRRLSGT